MNTSREFINFLFSQIHSSIEVMTVMYNTCTVTSQRWLLFRILKLCSLKYSTQKYINNNTTCYGVEGSFTGFEGCSDYWSLKYQTIGSSCLIQPVSFGCWEEILWKWKFRARGQGRCLTLKRPKLVRSGGGCRWKSHLGPVFSSPPPNPYIWKRFISSPCIDV